ncbi:hypothetical protein ACHAXT_009093 [Thalassiosira profunda]
MALHHHLTPEEFAASPVPPPTILLPKSDASRLVELCEWAEMQPSQAFIELAAGPGAASPNNGGARGNPRASVAQMALLLYLGEYGHARHLWRRASGGSAANADADSSHAQLAKLWSSAKYLRLWSTGGTDALAAGAAPPPAGGEGMQVEATAGEAAENGGLPHSTLALRALKECQTSGMEPLATYAGELIGVVRARVNRGLRRSFAKIDPKEWRLRLDLAPAADAGEGYGWTAEGEWLVPDEDFVPDEDVLEGDVAREEGDVGRLTDVVLFMEQKLVH